MNSNSANQASIFKASTSQAIPNAANRLHVDIVLGQPSEHCRYLGICKIEPEQNSTRPTGILPLDRAKASILLNEKKELVIYFDKESMNKETQQKHFNNSIFTVLEAIEIPDFLATAIGSTFILEAGQYAIETDEKFLKVVFSPAMTKQI